jgi:hypothetical protein
MKRFLLAVLILSSYSCNAANKVVTSLIPTIYAQTLPYSAKYTWTAPSDGSAVSYNCYLDSVMVINVTTTTCQVMITSLGPHVAAVTSVNPNDIPSESAQDTYSFKLQSPSIPAALGVK